MIKSGSGVKARHRFYEFRSGAMASLDQAIEALGQLAEAVDTGGDRAAAIVGDEFYASLNVLAAAFYTRYSVRRELLLLEHAAAAEKDAIRDDLQQAIRISRRVVQSGVEAAAAEALTIAGSCLALSHEDDPQQHIPAVIDDAVALLRDAVRRVATDDQASRLGVMDRLAGVLLSRGRLDDADEGKPPSLALRDAQIWARDHRYLPALAWGSFVHEGP